MVTSQPYIAECEIPLVNVTFLFFGGSGQRKLSVIPIDSEGYSGQQLRLASNHGKNILFLVPVQEELETVPLPLNAPEFAKMPKVACNNLQMLGLHVKAARQL